MTLEIGVRQSIAPCEGWPFRAMKNVHKIRGKREFLFDDRELFVLGTGAVIICALIFVLGFLVGQGIQQNAVAQSVDFMNPPLLDPAASVSEPEAPSVYENAESFPESNPGEKSGGSYFTVLPDREEYVEVEATPVKEAAPPATALKEDVPEPVATQPQADSGAEEPAAPATGDASTATRQNTVVAPVLPNVPRSPTDEMRVGRPAAGLDEGAALNGPLYSVQVASSPSYEDSERLQQKFIAVGYESLIMTADLGDRGIWYRVRVGNLSSKEAAEQMRRDILSRAAHLAKEPYVIKVDK